MLVAARARYGEAHGHLVAGGVGPRGGDEAGARAAVRGRAGGGVDHHAAGHAQERVVEAEDSGTCPAVGNVTTWVGVRESRGRSKSDPASRSVGSAARDRVKGDATGPVELDALARVDRDHVGDEGVAHHVHGRRHHRRGQRGGAVGRAAPRSGRQLPGASRPRTSYRASRPRGCAAGSRPACSAARIAIANRPTMRGVTEDRMRRDWNVLMTTPPVGCDGSGGSNPCGAAAPCRGGAFPTAEAPPPLRSNGRSRSL